MALERIPLSVEFSRNPELNHEDLEHFRDWVQKQPHLPPVEDGELVLFLHSCFYRLEAAKSTLDTYYTVRTHVPDFFAKRDASRKELKNAGKVASMLPLPDKTHEGHKVIWCRLEDYDPSHFDLTELFKLFLMITDLWLLSEGTAAGHVLVMDLQGLSLSHLTRLTLGALKKFFFYLQEAMPVRLKGLHFANTVSFIDKFMAIIRPFLKKELLDVLHLHTEGMESLYKFIPKAVLPSDYGGEAPEFKKLHELTQPRLLANHEWFKAEEKLRVVEAKRPGKAKSAGDLFGMEGSFKKLDID